MANLLYQCLACMVSNIQSGCLAHERNRFTGVYSWTAVMPGHSILERDVKQNWRVLKRHTDSPVRYKNLIGKSFAGVIQICKFK